METTQVMSIPQITEAAKNRLAAVSNELYDARKEKDALGKRIAALVEEKKAAVKAVNALTPRTKK